MGDLKGSARAQWSDPREADRIDPQGVDRTGPSGRPLLGLTIRELIVELEKVENTQLRDPATAGLSKSEQRRSRRESLILAELHRRRPFGA